MNMRTIGIGIVAVALILAISMTASARPDPVGADVIVQTNSVRLGHFNGTAGEVADHDGVALSTKQAQGYINCRLDTITGTTAFEVNIRYTDKDGASRTVIWEDASPEEDTWANISVTNLVDITHINWTSDADAGVYEGTIYANLSKQTAAQGTAGSDAAEGGYITEMDLSGNSQTVKWQGYYGEISGDIRLADESGMYMYTWDWVPSAGGAVFAAARTTMPNFQVVGTAACDITSANADTVLTTDSIWSAAGTDSVAVTFGTGNDSTTFYVAGNTVDSREKTYTQEYNTTAELIGTSSFEEVLLTDRATADIDTVDDMIWACLISADAWNYAGGTSDYQMIVPATDIGGETTTYYFYVEML